MGVVQLTINQIGGKKKPERVQTTREVGGKEEVVVYEQAGDRIRVLDEKSLEKRRRIEGMRPRKVLISIDRKTFVMATGASETELLGDVRHDPYGGHEGLGTPAFERVVAGAVHDAHRLPANDEFQETIEARCTICHTRARVDEAISQDTNLEELLQRMIERGAILSDRDQKVLGTFWGSPLKGENDDPSK